MVVSREIAVKERWPLYKGGHCRKVAVVKRRSLFRVFFFFFHCSEVVISRVVAIKERWSLYTVER